MHALVTVVKDQLANISTTTNLTLSRPNTCVTHTLHDSMTLQICFTYHMTYRGTVYETCEETNKSAAGVSKT